ncbi:hypothetical protein ACFQ4C_12080 [Larkinella insperata]|uniref:Uncharacterized protein n=1 Tax=Larkinella insperata TaxID=332158 RepID=A0ABW3QAG7_9BACT|nr:hypothetical protein [Larkinella insperata]
MEGVNSAEEEPLSEYLLTNPELYKYVGYLHQLLDMMYEETSQGPVDPMVETFLDCLMSVHRRIAFEGELLELDHILKMHFPDYYGHDAETTPQVLTNYPLSTCN